jgi:hypothetical protein
VADRAGPLCLHPHWPERAAHLVVEPMKLAAMAGMDARQIAWALIREEDDAYDSAQADHHDQIRDLLAEIRWEQENQR